MSQKLFSFRKVFPVVITPFLFSVVSGCHSRSVEPRLVRYHESRELFGTTAQIDICVSSQGKKRLPETYRRIWVRLEEIHRNFNFFDEGSEINRLNHSRGHPVTVTPELFRLLMDAQRYHRLTEGAFDITVNPLRQIWTTAERKDQIPSPEEIRTNLDVVGFEKILFQNGNKVAVPSAQMSVDMGGMIPGYAADVAAVFLREGGWEDFFIDMGGEIYVGGENCQNQEWRIGVRDPLYPEAVLDMLHLKNKGVSTSGTYERFYTIRGQRFSHIINPKTGYPSMGVLSATVIAPTTQEADALSTALCVLPASAGIRLVDALGKGYAAMTIATDINGHQIRRESKNYSYFRK